MFCNPKDEERICQILRAYVEEFGAENVVVALPRAWKTNDYNLGATRLEFSTQSAIAIRVEYDQVKLQYQVELAA